MPPLYYCRVRQNPHQRSEENLAARRASVPALKYPEALPITAARQDITFTLACTPCPADLNGDGMVDSSDASLALLDFGFCPGCLADLDGDSNVDSSDISLLLLDIGTCP